MRYSLLLTFLMMNLYGAASYISKGGEGLYVDAAFIPSWRNHRSNANLIYYEGAADDGATGFNALIKPKIYSFANTCDTYTPALRVRADLAPSRKASIQGIYEGLYEWRFKEVAYQNNANIGFSIYPYGNWSYGPNYIFKTFKRIFIDYKEDLNSFEINYLDHLTPRYYDYFSVALSGGIRGIKHSNQANFAGVPSALSGEPAVTMDASLFLKNINTFIGGQIGGIFKYRMFKRLYIDVPVKGAIYANIIDSHFLIKYPNYVNSNYELTTLEDRNKIRTGVGYSLQTTPKFEYHIGYFYAMLGGNFLFLHGSSPVSSQIAGWDLDKYSCSHLLVYGVLIGGGFHI